MHTFPILSSRLLMLLLCELRLSWSRHPAAAAVDQLRMTSQTRQLFGTDGIRGVAGKFPLTQESTFLIGRALGPDLVRTNPQASVVIGQDSRESSAWIADRVTLGLASCGCQAHSAGVITTPGVAYLAR